MQNQTYRNMEIHHWLSIDVTLQNIWRSIFEAQRELETMTLDFPSITLMVNL
jgi:hypothetical protein